MKKRFLTIFLLLLTVLLCAGCGNAPVEAVTLSEEELSKLPEGFPIKATPLYRATEIVSVVNNGSDSYFSYEVTFNSDAEYQAIIDYYESFFNDPKTKDFGIAYNILYVPATTGYMCNYNIYSSLTKGETGQCTVIMTVSDY